ncbi:MAG: amidohydrolase, partial [Candidatus Omnitrophica bacterium]|nr:amidohydrolase [Candidatus Omnitrophota bacterium]
MIIANQAKKIQSDLVEFRRKLHRHPEPSYKEVITSSLLIDQIRTLGYSVREKQRGMGVVADLAPHRDEGFVLIRADMDSLPIQEES